jgi:hypothetical protein
MSPDITILLVTAASIGFFHTLTGPDHYLPFIVMSEAGNWNTGQTLRITFLCGLGHEWQAICQVGFNNSVPGFSYITVS